LRGQFPFSLGAQRCMRAHSVRAAVGDKRARIPNRCSCLTELKRFAATLARSHVKEHEDCGAPKSLRPLRKLGSLSAPRLCGDIAAPKPPLLARFRLADGTGSCDRAFRPGGWRGTPEAGPLPCRRWSSLLFVSGPVVRRHLRRRVPSPEKQTVCSSRPHGRGMGHCNRALDTGDKFAQEMSS
jgi:hypothetical protein